ncbi:MAG: arsenite methyltransferase [Desulforhopalus sp.]|jgi:arsenite methyltransferase
MKPLYLTPPVRDSLGTCLRPGGETLTRRAIEILGPEIGSVIVDAGCGAGGSLGILSGMGALVFGVDLAMELLMDGQKIGTPLVQADLARLPLADCSVDTLFCECAWNLTSKVQVLSEFFRVLRPGGRLVLNDIYLRVPEASQGGNSWPVTSCFSFATDLTSVSDMVAESGFEVDLLEDHITLLKQTAAEFVFAHGSLQAFWSAVLGDDNKAERVCSLSAKTRPSLFLLIAKRGEE